MTEDLSLRHAPVCKLFASSGEDAVQLSDAQLNRFDEQGFLSGVRLLSAVLDLVPGYVPLLELRGCGTGECMLLCTLLATTTRTRYY